MRKVNEKIGGKQGKIMRKENTKEKRNKILRNKVDETKENKIKKKQRK